MDANRYQPVIEMARVTFLFLILIGSFQATAQDQEWSFFPTLLPGVYTHDRISLKNYNPLIIGVVPFSRKALYGEVRYNYDFNNTLGLYLGKAFRKDRKTTHILTPQLGFLRGDFNGISIQLYYQLTGDNFEINYQNQFSIQNTTTPKSFYYNWSDIQLAIAKYFRLGASVQFYKGFDQNYLDPGLLFGYRTSRVYVALIDFKFYIPSKHYFFLGLQYTINK